MGLPTAPFDGDGDKIHFLVYDGGGTNAAAVWRAYRTETVNGETYGEAGVYPKSGALKNGAMSMTGGARICIIGYSVPAQSVTVKAYKENAETVWVGEYDVTDDHTPSTGGFPLEPGEWHTFPCRNLDEVYIKGVGTDGVAFVAGID